MKIHANARLTPAARLILVQRITRGGFALTEAAEAAGVSAKTARKWVARYREGGRASLWDRSSRPHLIARRMPAEVEVSILALRRLGMIAIEISACLGVPARTVSRVCHRHGLGRLRDLSAREPENRYERDRPGELLHMDVKKLGRITQPGHRVHGDRRSRGRGAGWEYVHNIVDDATRLAYSEVHPDERKHTAIRFLERAHAWFAARGVRIERVLTDNGSAYLSADFKKACHRLGITHKRTRPYRPRTNGKVERYIQTLTRRWAYGQIYASSSERTQALPAWTRAYNNRPHRGLNGTTPLERLHALRGNNLMANHN